MIPAASTARRLLLVTVGSSLFHSASWDPEGPLAAIRGYAEWTRPPLLASPGSRKEMCSRRATGRDVAEALRELLAERAGDAAERAALAAQVAADGAGEPLRYSAEVTTLLRLFQEEARGGPLDAFLGRYAEARLLCSGDPHDDSHVAAVHLAEVLGRLAPSVRPRVEPVLDPGGLREQLPALVRYLDRRVDREAKVDLVVSGGYKAYTAIAGWFLGVRPLWRSVYLHETGADLITEENRQILVNLQPVASGPGARDL